MVISALKKYSIVILCLIVLGSIGVSVWLAVRVNKVETQIKNVGNTVASLVCLLDQNGGIVLAPEARQTLCGR